eukprot:jgi/Mesen1/11023/ME000098S10415
MADYEHSTQRLRWLLVAQDVFGTTTVEVKADGLRAPDNEAAVKQGDPSSPLPEPLTVDEEVLLCKYFEVKIQAVCSAFNFPIKIQATAITYFKRFYLHWSVMEHMPKHIMLTCIYLACKVEEVYVSAEEFGKGINQDPEQVLTNELMVLQTLHFDLITYAPYRALEGFLIDMQSFWEAAGDAPPSKEQLQSYREKAKGIVDSIMLTDAPLTHPPGQLALAALGMANDASPVVDMDKYVQRAVSKRQQQGSSGGSSSHDQSAEELASTIASIKQHVAEAGEVPPADAVKPLDKKLKYCRDPQLFAQDEQKRKSRKEKQKKQKRAPHDAKPSSTPPLDADADNDMDAHDPKRRRSVDVLMTHSQHQHQEQDQPGS